MCQRLSEATKIDEERWLSQTSVQDAIKVREFLLNARPPDEVIHHGQFLMDVSDFCILACDTMSMASLSTSFRFNYLRKVSP